MRLWAARDSDGKEYIYRTEPYWISNGEITEWASGDLDYFQIQADIAKSGSCVELAVVPVEDYRQLVNDLEWAIENTSDLVVLKRRETMKKQNGKCIQRIRDNIAKARECMKEAKR